MHIGIHLTDAAYGTSTDVAGSRIEYAREFVSLTATSTTAAAFMKTLHSTFDPIVAAGLKPFTSVKLTAADVVAGKCDALITAYGQYLATLDTPYATIWHEPESSLTASAYMSMFNYVYPRIKALAPHCMFGTVHELYLWRSTAVMPVASQKAWLSVKAADFHAADTYSSDWSDNTLDLSQKADFLLWLNAVKAYAPSKTIALAERGISHTNNTRGQNNVIAADLAYLASLTGVQVALYSYWSGAGATDGTSDYTLDTTGRATLWNAALAANPVPVQWSTYPLGGNPLYCGTCSSVIDPANVARHYAALHSSVG